MNVGKDMTGIAANHNAARAIIQQSGIKLLDKLITKHAGKLENPKVDFMIGQHVMPFIEVGKIGFRQGLYMASADEIFVTVKGKGGHGAMP